jgi:hypothetical protein
VGRDKGKVAFALWLYSAGRDAIGKEKGRLWMNRKRPFGVLFVDAAA